MNVFSSSVLILLLARSLLFKVRQPFFAMMPVFIYSGIPLRLLSFAQKNHLSVGILTSAVLITESLAISFAL